MNLTKRIIPCLDIKNGRVVKGVKFKDLCDAGDPVEIAQYYCEAGADELVFLDITATCERSDLLFDLIKSIASKIFIPFTVGGGVCTISDIKKLLNCGADKISINSAAIKNPYFIYEVSKKYGSQCIVSAIDVKKYVYGKNKFKWNVYINSGTKNTGLDVFSWSRIVADLGVGEILLTSMNKDGTKSGFDVELINKVSKLVSVPVIASGGAGSLEHFSDVLTHGLADAVLAASVFHYNLFSIQDCKKFLFRKGISVRL